MVTEIKPNPEFEKKVAELGGADVKMCFQCGTCTAGCPSGRRTSYRVRKLMRQAQLGLREEIINSEELWDCSTCYTCVERCPRAVPIVDIVVALRN
ncbi:MAG: 4Fe-4S dicluster domain-containing protein, partial [Candidatus Methanoplasma sp.]|nr:4Fe-4S dicluster domain-containing protein [Candidatus Methanoplasma sp.]